MLTGGTWFIHPLRLRKFSRVYDAACVFYLSSTNSRNDVAKISFRSKRFERKELLVRLEKEKIGELLHNNIRVGFFERLRSNIMNFKIQS